MAFDGKEGEQISLSEGAAMTANYRNSDGASGAKAHFIGKDILNSILSQTGCMGIRVYYGIDDSGNKELVFVGANAQQNDMTSGIIAERIKPCPPYCDENNSQLAG
jgi:hypothetical protein